ncbi:hypothetical protein H012_gp299 [Acanthamoeba polyphaga moumouvirus]|uniref:Uncharacterized protein n=1 Tax=Acanthamoeba polyphaga moumouvirus TaxID=1269028 RepID=L7RGG4_9VIRU|nr:hypothetical protein H012_gp299 [Acanthamoeba polyphaga moumouvirus]AGC02155.1 hypothetical protein Moumou_00631 [Acanthamoeba polyphaga moumouvirus]
MSKNTISYSFDTDFVNPKKDKIFNISDFRPIGILTSKYPETYCVYCRDYLSEPCNTCQENNNFDCDVSITNGQCFHSHCQKEFSKK